MRNEETKQKWLLIISMIIFGTIGLIRRYVDLPSSIIAMARGIIGACFILLYIKLSKRCINQSSIKNNLPRLLISGAFLGINWILLFEAYKHTTIAIATLCYYLAPVIVIVASPIVLKERLTVKKACCVLVALIGMFLVSGAGSISIANISELKGVFLALLAAVLYAAIVLNNKKLGDVPALDRTFVQLGLSGIILVPYNLISLRGETLSITPLALILVLLMGVLHTGVAYALYFGALQTLNAQTAAICSYIDPIVAILCSAILLREPMTILGWLGSVLVLGALLVGELNLVRKE